jgi:hypothetical protein
MATIAHVETGMSHIQALQISPAPSGPALTPSQKRFNTLLREIERARQTLAAWRENSATYRQAYAQAVQPLQEELFAGHRQWLPASVSADVMGKGYAIHSPSSK